jgi:hypothetical protein
VAVIAGPAGGRLSRQVERAVKKAAAIAGINRTPPAGPTAEATPPTTTRQTTQTIAQQNPVTKKLSFHQRACSAACPTPARRSPCGRPRRLQRFQEQA